MRPIQYAAFIGNVEVFNFVLECNAEFRDEQIKSQMPSTMSNLVHLSAYKGACSIFDLIADKVSPVAKNRLGDTPLHIAIRNNQQAFVERIVTYAKAKRLTAKESEVENHVEKENLTPFMLAVLLERFEIAKILLDAKLATKEYVNVNGRSIFHMCQSVKRRRSLAFLEDRIIPPKKKRGGSIGPPELDLNKQTSSGMISPESIGPSDRGILQSHSRRHS